MNLVLSSLHEEAGSELKLAVEKSILALNSLLNKVANRGAVRLEMDRIRIEMDRIRIEMDRIRIEMSRSRIEMD